MVFNAESVALIKVQSDSFVTQKYRKLIGIMF